MLQRGSDSTESEGGQTELERTSIGREKLRTHYISNFSDSKYLKTSSTRNQMIANDLFTYPIGLG